MAVFPELIPSTRTYSPGAFPHTAHRVYNGSEARVRHSNTVLGARLRLFFPALTSAELINVIAHYNGQQGRFLPFAIPDDLLSGTTTPADFTPTGHQWRYAAKPTVEDISVDDGTNLHNLTVELETVPPENTIAQGARLRARASLRAGSAQLGEFLDVFTLLDAGNAFGSLALSATAILEAGSPFPVVSLDVVATLEAGEAIFSVPGGFFVTATLDAGVATGTFDMLALSPVAWWDASDATTVTTSSGLITDWDDKSGNGWDLTQPTAGDRPTYTSAGMNGLNVAEWPAAPRYDFMQSASGTFELREMYVVLDSAYVGVFDVYGGILTSQNDDWYITGSNGAEGLQVQAGTAAYINGGSTDRDSNLFPEMESPCLLRVTTDALYSTTSGVVVGRDRYFGVRVWRGLMGEMVVFSAPLSAGNRAALETHLMSKWGI